MVAQASHLCSSSLQTLSHTSRLMVTYQFFLRPSGWKHRDWCWSKVHTRINKPPGCLNGWHHSNTIFPNYHKLHGYHPKSSTGVFRQSMFNPKLGSIKSSLVIDIHIYIYIYRQYPQWIQIRSRYVSELNHVKSTVFLLASSCPVNLQ